MNEYVVTNDYMISKFRLAVFTQFGLQDLTKGSFTAKQGGADFGHPQPKHWKSW